MSVGRPLAAIGALVALLAAPAAWGAAPSEPAAPLEQAREAARVSDPPPTRHELPAGVLRLSRSELLASSGLELELAVTLDRPVSQGALELTLPALWVQRSGVSGLRFARVPAAGRTHGAGARSARSGRVVRLSFDDASAGASATFTLSDVGIPAGRYELPFRWREAGREGGRPGTARVQFYAPLRERAEGSADGDWRLLLRESNATDDAAEQAEAFVTAVPGNRQRYVVGANIPVHNAWITNNGGVPFTQAPVSATLDVPGKVGPETATLCCDPISAADNVGNLWYGGRALGSPGKPSRIVVTRAPPPGAAFLATSVGLPIRAGGEQDKPMMTIDNSPASPTFGRLYVVWSERDAGLSIVMSQCDTRPGGVLAAARCDNADNWTLPVGVTSVPGNYIYADVAVGPDAKVYVVWWDTSAANAIRGDVCDPVAQDCASEAGWGTPQTIALLDATGGLPLPGNCPIPAQPGGRAAPSPQVEVDRSAGPHAGRVYVTWSDLRTGSGSTRCAFDLTTPNPIDGIAPAETHLTWDTFVASAAGALPGGAGTSPTVATRLLTDGEGGGQASSDDWFAWLAVDQTTGLAWADFYSTRDDPTRRTTNFYLRSVVPDGAGHVLGALRAVSTMPSDYSTNPCCNFGDDYGDYAGIDATQGHAIPVWADRRNGLDGEVYVDVVPAVALVAGAPGLDDSPAAGGNGDGALQPGESFRLAASLRNAGAAVATGVSATLTAPVGSGVTLTQAASSYPDIAAGATAPSLAPFAGALDAGVPCGTPIALTLRATTATESAVVALALPTACPAVAPPASPPLPASLDDTIVFALTGKTRQKPPTSKRGIVVKLLCPFEDCRVAIGATLTIGARARGGKARRLKLRSSTLRVTRARRRSHTFRPSATQRRQIARAMRSDRTRFRVRVAVTATARDAAGNASRKTKSIRVRR